MILSIAGATGAGIVAGQDLSGFVDRSASFSIEAAVGKRIDTSEFTLMDTLPSSLAIPDKAELIIYDVTNRPDLSWAAAVLGLQPSAYYRLNDTGGTARDWTGRGNTGTLVGTITKGVAGGLADGDTAMSFDGSTARITTAAAPTPITLGSAWSFQALVKPTSSTPVAISTVIEYGRDDTPNNGFLMFQQATNGIPRIERWVNGVQVGVTASAALSALSATHLIGVYDGANLILYVNGVAFSVSDARAWIASAAPTFIIGSRNAGSSPFAGMIDEVAVYPFALLPSQVSALNSLVTRCAPDAQVTDPTWAVSAYNTWRNGAGSEVTSPTAANWTPRMFGGYVATPNYSAADGPQRYIKIAAQDYTVRLRTTVANMAFAVGNADQAIIQQLFARYRPDYNTTHVDQLLAGFPAITYPVHTLEQCLERVIKVTRGYYRADYYKQLWYGAIGQQTAPFNLSDVPNYTTTFPTEGIDYTPDGSGLVNRVWVIGSTYLGNQQAYQVPPTLVNGANYQFPLPGNPELTGMVITVAGVDQGQIGVAPGDGDTAMQSSFKYNTLIQHNPATVSFKTTPSAGQAIIVTGKFRYPLVQVVTDTALIAATNGIVFEAIVRDKRIADKALAVSVGQAYLKNQGSTLKGGSCTIRTRSVGGVLLQPGMVITIKNDVLFRSILKDANGNPTTTAVVIVTQLETNLDDDSVQPYAVKVSFADRSVSGGY